MAKTESEGDGDQTKDTEVVQNHDASHCRTDTVTPSSEGVSEAGAGLANSGRRNRRKQSDPRRLDSEIVNVKLEIESMDISTDAVEEANEYGDDDDDDEHIEDEVFSKVRKKDIDCDENSHTVPGSGHSNTSNRHFVMPKEDCEPKDLSIGRRKPEHEYNNSFLEFPSAIRPSNSGTNVHYDTNKVNTHMQNFKHCFNAFPHQVLPNHHSLVDVERDCRTNYEQDYDDDYHDVHSDTNDYDHSLCPNDKLSLESECDVSSPDLHTGRKNGKTSPSTSTSSSSSTSHSSKSKKQPRSYKNLSRSRRIVANARERNRVHTISAAFEGLRRAVPSYSHNQKLSKLAILRIACSYILALAKLADLDYSPDQTQMTFEDCVDLCTQTLQAEGRSKRRKTATE